MEAPDSPNSLEMSKAGKNLPKVKGGWSQVVRGNSSYPAAPEATSKTEENKQVPPPSSPKVDPKVTPSSPVSPQVCPEETKPVKQAWKRPVVEKPSPVGVMGAVSWPALGDTSAPSNEVLPKSSETKVASKKLVDVDTNGEYAKPGNNPDRRPYQGYRRNDKNPARTPRYNNNNNSGNNYAPTGRFIARQYVTPAPYQGFTGPPVYYVPAPGGYYPPTIVAPPPPPVNLPEVNVPDAILKQVEYYFSKENLVKDLYLRTIMDPQGFVPVATIANFNKIKSLTTEINVLVDALRPSTSVEVQDDKIRKRDDWQYWVLSNEVKRPQAVSPSSTLQVLEESNEGLKNGDTQELGITGELTIGFTSVDDRDKEGSTSQNEDTQMLGHNHNGVAEDVKDDGFRRLIIVTQREKQPIIPDEVAKLINEGLLSYEKEHHSQENALSDLRLQHPQRLFHSATEDALEKDVFSESRCLGFMYSPNVQSTSELEASPNFQHPAHALLEKNGFVQHMYVTFRERCLADRERLGIGRSEDMNILFRFWSYFLLRNFNSAMYLEFWTLAEEDERAGFPYGMDSLTRFIRHASKLDFYKKLSKAVFNCHCQLEKLPELQRLMEAATNDEKGVLVQKAMRNGFLRATTESTIH